MKKEDVTKSKLAVIQLVRDGKKMKEIEEETGLTSRMINAAVGTYNRNNQTSIPFPTNHKGTKKNLLPGDRVSCRYEYCGYVYRLEGMIKKNQKKDKYEHGYVVEITKDFDGLRIDLWKVDTVFVRKTFTNLIDIT